MKQGELAENPDKALPGDRMPSLKERYTKKQVEESIRKCDGRWAAIVRDLNCSYGQLRVWMEHHPDHARLADQARDSAVHEAEQVVWDMLHSEDEETRKDAAKFVLRTLGRDRGWGEGRQAVAVQAVVQDGQVELKSVFGF